MGVFAVGLIAGADVLLTRAMTEGYRAINPASAVLHTDPFDRDLVEVVQRIPGVKAAEGRRSVRVRVQVGGEEWRDLQLAVIPALDEIRVDVIRPEGGARTPAFREVLLERSSVGMLGKGTGDVLRVETADGRVRELAVAGLVHDLNRYPSLLSGTAYGYVTPDTSEWLGWSRSFNELRIVVDGSPDQVKDVAYIRQLAAEVARKVERSGRKVHSTWIGDPDRLPAVEELIRPLLAILGALGFLSLLLRGFLVANTMAAVLAQQVRQIGVMKAVGARTFQLVSMYLGTVLAFSLAGLAVGIPLAFAGARGVAGFVAGLANLEIPRYELGGGVLLLEAGVGILVPLAAAAHTSTTSPGRCALRAGRRAFR